MNGNPPLIVGSTFSGVGGIDLGLERAGMRVAWNAEYDPWCRDVLAHHWPDARQYADVRDVDGEAQRVDLLCGGFPCQDLSVAGKRKGLAGERSGLFHEFARIARTLRPRWLLIENVPGLFTSQHGRDFGVVFETLAEIGYGVAWRTLDSRYFGVPQRRRRVFIVGHLGGSPRSALHALCESCIGSAPARECTWQKTPGGARGSTHGGVVVSALTRKQGGPDDNDAQGGRLGDQAPGTGTGNGGAVAVAFNLRGREGGAQAEVSDVASIRAASGGSSRSYISSSGVRRLTPRECERLQGFPDDWTLIPGVKCPDSRRYAAMGNAVTVNVAEWIGRRIVALDEAMPETLLEAAAHAREALA